MGALGHRTAKKVKAACNDSLVPRPSPAPVFDRLQYASMYGNDQKLEPEKAWERGYVINHKLVGAGGDGHTYQVLNV